MNKISPKMNDAVGMLILGLVLFFAAPALLAYVYPEDYGGGFNTRYLFSALGQLVGALAIIVSVTTICFRFVKNQIIRRRH
jgi:hypothetical protein